MSELIEKYEWVFRLVEVFAVVVGVWFIARQTRHMSQNISNIQEGLELERGSAIYHYNELINPVLVEHPELAEAFGLTRQDAFAYLIIGEFQRLFHLRKEGVIEDSRWDAFKDPMKKTMNTELVKKVWVQQKGVGRGTTDEFEKFIETLAYSDN